MTPIPVTPEEFQQLVLSAMTLSAAGLAGDFPYGADLPESVSVCIAYEAGIKPVVPNDFLGSFQDLLWIFQDYCLVTAPRPERSIPGPRGASHKWIQISRRGAPSAHEIIAASSLLGETLARIGVGQKQIAHLLALSAA